MCSFGHHICSYWRNGCFTRERGSCGASSFADPEQVFKQEGQYHRKTKCADEWEDDRSQDAFLWSGGRSGVLHHLDEINGFNFKYFQFSFVMFILYKLVLLSSQDSLIVEQVIFRL